MDPLAALEPDASYTVMMSKGLAGRDQQKIQLDDRAMSLLTFRTEPFQVNTVGNGDGEHFAEVRPGEVGKEMSEVPYKVVKGPNGEARVQTKHGEFSPPEISAQVLRALKETAEDYLGENIDGRYFTSAGYPVTFGNSFVMVLEFTADGPVAQAVLTYGQPDDPANPDFTAQTKVYSGKDLRAVLFTPDEVAAGAVGDTLTVTGDRG